MPRRLTVTSSSNEISTDQMGNAVLERVGGRRYSARPHPFLQQPSRQIFKGDVNGFPPSQIFTSLGRQRVLHTCDQFYVPERSFMHLTVSC